MAIIDDPKPTFWRNKKRRPTLQVQWFDKGARRKKGNTNRRTTRQQTYRLQFTKIRNLWLTLTTAQRDTWITFANNFTSINRYGNTIVLGAWQWFARYNTALSSTSQSLIVNAPPDDIPTYNPSFSIGTPIVDTDLSFTISPSPGSDESILYRRKINTSPGTSKPPLPLEYDASFDSLSSSPMILVEGEEQPYVGRRHWFEFRPYDEFGRLGNLTFENRVVEE